MWQLISEPQHRIFLSFVPRPRFDPIDDQGFVPRCSHLAIDACESSPLRMGTAAAPLSSFSFASCQVALPPSAHIELRWNRRQKQPRWRESEKQQRPLASSVEQANSPIWSKKLGKERRDLRREAEKERGLEENERDGISILWAYHLFWAQQNHIAIYPPQHYWIDPFFFFYQ
jgi:hypothetical protein